MRVTSWLVIIGLLVSFKSYAEPWLSNRFATNCAACHSPSRYNLPAKKRRCTLSCQGCHVNPNGGGLRSQYGKWNSDRWLKSFSTATPPKHKNAPQPWYKQNYVKQKQIGETLAGLKAKDSQLNRKVIPKGKLERSRLIEELSKVYKSPKRTKKRRSNKRKAPKTNASSPPRLATQDGGRNLLPESLFERDNGDPHWTITAKSRSQYEELIPPNDPYFLRRNSVLVGMDMRFQNYWLSSSSLNDNTSQADDRQESANWPMALDIGVQLRPFEQRFNDFSLVVETRYLSRPDDSQFDDVVTNSVVNKSAYLLYDNLPYNSFIMAGVYRPMFDHYTSDHDSLAQHILYEGQAYTYQNQAVTVGLAPNVPFFNLHLIQPIDNKIQHEGFAANLGARWVTMGASLVYSYRSIVDQSTTSRFETTAHAIQGGIKWNRWILNGELLNIKREDGPDSYDNGSVLTVESRFKLYRESYLELIAESANVSAALGNPSLLDVTKIMEKGSSSRYLAGFRFFTLNGVQWSAHYVTTNDSPSATGSEDFNEKMITSQVHLFF